LPSTRSGAPGKGRRRLEKEGTGKEPQWEGKKKPAEGSEKKRKEHLREYNP